MIKPQRKVEITLLEAMETWARYRIGRVDGGLGWPKKVLLGKWRDGLPTNLCPICIGKEKPHHNCPVCGGDGRVKLEARDNKANPAFISGNGQRSHYDDDPVSQRIDWLICVQLTEYQRLVVMATFTSNGTQEQKARKMGISQGYFSSLLGEGLEQIKRGLDNQY